MKQLVCLIFCILCVGISQNTSAQTTDSDILTYINSDEYENNSFDQKIKLIEARLKNISFEESKFDWGVAVSQKLINLAKLGEFEVAKSYLDEIESKLHEALTEGEHYYEALYGAAFIRVFSQDIEQSLLLIERMRNQPEFKNNIEYQQKVDTLLVAIHTQTGNSILAAELLIKTLNSKQFETLPLFEQLKLLSNISYAFNQAKEYERAENYIKIGLEKLEGYVAKGILSDREIVQISFFIHSNFSDILIKQSRYSELKEIFPTLQANGSVMGGLFFQAAVDYVQAAIHYGADQNEKAVELIEETVKKGIAMGGTDVLIKYHGLQAEILQKAGDDRGALAAYLAKQKIADNIKAEQSRARTIYTNIQASLREQNAQIKDLEARNKIASQLRKRDQLIAAISILALVTMLLFTIGLIRSRMRLKSYAEELEKSEKIAQTAVISKSAFLANMSHEIRTPLNGLLGMAQILAQHSTNAEQKKCIDIILSSGKSLLTIVNDVLDISKIEAGKVQIEPLPHNLKHLLKELTELWLVKAEEKNIPLELTYENEIPEQVLIDGVRVRQCISNLISNAIKFTDKGRVCVKVKWSSKDSNLVIQVIDSGIGISKENASRLFKAFEQGDSSTSRKFGGTGLGLSITRNLAQMMGGDVTVSSKQGEGSTFILTLYAEETQKINDIEVTNNATFKFTQNTAIMAQSILLVDDNPVNRLVAKAFIKNRTLKVIEAGDGLEALELLTLNKDIDLILLDMHMPLLDGPATVRKIRESNKIWRDIPIIALTADAMEGDRERYLSMGIDGYIAKPIVQAELENEITKVLEQEQINKTLVIKRVSNQ